MVGGACIGRKLVALDSVGSTETNHEPGERVLGRRGVGGQFDR